MSQDHCGNKLTLHAFPFQIFVTIDSLPSSTTRAPTLLATENFAAYNA